MMKKVEISSLKFKNKKEHEAKKYVLLQIFPPI